VTITNPIKIEDMKKYLMFVKENELITKVRADKIKETMNIIAKN
jgi:hypothetical protein